MKECFRKPTAISIALALLATAAVAETRTAVFAVSANVAKACTISGAPLAFGALNVLAGTNVDATATLTATCTQGSAYTIGLSAGSAPGATTADRRMTLATDSSRTLSYSLSAVGPGGANWGAIGETGVPSGTGSGTDQPIVVYGRIPGGQTSAVMGTYSDLIVATIDF
jgi:spore coat protein U-like protein